MSSLKTDHACKFKCSDESKQKITNCLNSEEIKNSLNELHSCLNDMTVSEAVSRLRQMFVNISDKSFEKINFGKVGINKKGKHKKVPWMNEECKAQSARKRYQESIRIHSDARKQAELRDAYFDERRNHHKKCRKLERSYWNQQKQDLSNFRSRDPKEFWKKLNLKPKSKSYQFTKSDLFDYYEKLASSQVDNDQYAEFDYQQNVEVEKL